MLFQQQK